MSTPMFLDQRIDCNHIKHTGTIPSGTFERNILWLPTTCFRITMFIWKKYIFLALPYKLLKSKKYIFVEIIEINIRYGTEDMNG